jgi:hypothetical protein
VPSVEFDLPRSQSIAEIVAEERRPTSCSFPSSTSLLPLLLLRRHLLARPTTASLLPHAFLPLTLIRPSPEPHALPAVTPTRPSHVAPRPLVLLSTASASAASRAQRVLLTPFTKDVATPYTVLVHVKHSLSTSQWQQTRRTVPSPLALPLSVQ